MISQKNIYCNFWVLDEKTVSDKILWAILKNVLCKNSLRKRIVVESKMKTKNFFFNYDKIFFMIKIIFFMMFFMMKSYRTVLIKGSGQNETPFMASEKLLLADIS